MKHILFYALFGSTIFGFCQVKPNVRSDSVKPSSNPTHSYRIDSLEKALEGANQEDRFNRQLQLFGNYMNSDSGKAVFYLNKCLDQAALSGDSLWIVKSSNYDKALHYNFESLRVREKDGDSTEISIALNNIAFRKSLELSQTIGLSKLTAANFYWLASVKFEGNQIDSAINFLDRSQRIVSKYSLPKITLENYQLYTKIYTQKKDYQRALNYQRLYNQLNTEILNGDLIGKISRIQIDKEQRENTSKLVSQAAIMTFQEESLQRHRVLNVLIGAVGILTMGLAIMLYKINRQKQKVNEVLDQLVKERTFELKNNRDELKRAHDGQTLITNKLSSDLVSSLATLRGLSNMASKDLPQEQRVYFNEVEAMAEKLVNQVNKYSLPG